MSSEILRLPMWEVFGDKEKKSFAWEKDDVHIFSGDEVWDYDNGQITIANFTGNFLDDAEGKT